MLNTRIFGAFAVLLTLAAGVILIGSCESKQMQVAARITGGNPKSGREKITRYGCPACHEIPGINVAKGRVGPPLEHIASRTYLGGEIPNTPRNMMLWVRTPRTVEPHTAMPDMGVTEDDARDITAYLYSLP